MRYYHKDHLGSIAVITNSAAAVVERLAYEAFGERRNTNGTPQDRASPLVGVTTDRGFTEHEHLDELNLIHMNGRIYDPALARFMTPDPFIQAHQYLQSYNRYSYGFNNPLRGTDPTGFNWLTDFVDDTFEHAVGPVVEWAGDQVFNGLDSAERRCNCSPVDLVISIGGAIVTGGAFAEAGYGAFAASVAGGAASGFASGGPEGGVQGALSGALFWGAGEYTNPGLARVAAHAVAGCLSSAAGGGSCKTGALAAGFTEAIVGNFTITDRTAALVVRMVTGGVAARMGGGKFANGATTAAFGYLFNHLAHELGDPNAQPDCYDCRMPGVDKASDTENLVVGVGMGLLPGAQVGLASLLPRAYWLLSGTELSGLIGPTQTGLLREFFGRGLPGALSRAENFVVPNALTTQAASAYRELAVRAISHYERIGNQAGIAIQRARIDLLERAGLVK
jgi:RHS repeat-associated protein